MASGSIWETAKQQEIGSRLGKLTAQSKPAWGKMNAAQVLFHLGAAIRMATGELPVASKAGPLRFPPLRYLIIHVVPLPKGVPTAPELIAPAGVEFAANRQDAIAAFDRLVAAGSDQTFVAHPAFGKLSNGDWGKLIYKHMDHHLRQFRV